MGERVVAEVGLGVDGVPGVKYRHRVVEKGSGSRPRVSAPATSLESFHTTLTTHVGAT